MLVDDNYDDQDEDRRYTHSAHQDPVAALLAARKIVDDCLAELFKPGMTGQDLYDAYRSFCEDPFIQTSDRGFERFFCMELCETALQTDLACCRRSPLMTRRC